MATSDTHPDKDYRKLIGEYEDIGWSSERGAKKMKMRCPCGQHGFSVSLTPSSQRTLINTEATFKRLTRQCQENAS